MPTLDGMFHEDSYAYRPMKSAHDALAKARERCFRYEWVLDMDISKFFDTINHELLLKAVRLHVKEQWMLLYIERWLKVPYQGQDGNIIERDKGVPQGSVIGPVLANLFLHYVFDKWMQIHYPNVPFERYADDTICHCQSEEEAVRMKTEISGCLSDCLPALNEDKTRIVHCSRHKKPSEYPNVSFDFLGYTFRRRVARNKLGQGLMTVFTPAISKKSGMKIKETMRQWKLSSKVMMNLKQIADYINSQVRGWIVYYARFNRSEFRKVMRCLNEMLGRWLERKYKTLRGKLGKAMMALFLTAKNNPHLFAHWSCGFRPYIRKCQLN